MSDGVLKTLEVCPLCGDLARVRWAVGSDGQTEGSEAYPITFKCCSGCSLHPPHLAPALHASRRAGAWYALDDRQ